jgi:single-stranded-DNA-specific exonuclease
MNIVVTDHHQVPEDFEPLCPVINPHRSDSSFPFKNLAGVGLAFFLTVALRSALRDEGWFKNAPEPDLRHYLDLVALGTVADMVPLLDQNRILVKWGVDRMKVSQWPGIKAIREIAAVDALKITSSDLAFKLAPRLNAPGRLGSAEMAIDLLTTDDLSIAKNLARQLNILNGERQGVEQDILDQIEGLMEYTGPFRQGLAQGGLGNRGIQASGQISSAHTGIRYRRWIGHRFREKHRGLQPSQGTEQA